MKQHGSVAGAQWGQWSKLGLCSMTCGAGTAYRPRECRTSRWGPWAQWGASTTSCDGGQRQRYRLCEKMKNNARVLAHDCEIPGNTTSSKEIVQKDCNTQNKRGELLVSLCYQPVDGVIEVGIKQGRNLKSMDIGGTSDPYVKIWQLVREKRIDKKKTITVKNCLNPNFSEIFTFESPMNNMRETQLEISVMDRDVIGRNEVIGKIYLGTKKQLSGEAPLEGNVDQGAAAGGTMAHTQSLRNRRVTTISTMSREICLYHGVIHCAA